MVEITVGILSVDGETCFDAKSNDILNIHKFLDVMDHEGSSVNISATAHGEDAYKLLDLLEKMLTEKR